MLRTGIANAAERGTGRAELAHLPCGTEVSYGAMRSADKAEMIRKQWEKKVCGLQSWVELYSERVWPLGFGVKS
eukprot:3477893-Rhodomonas_salina.4